MNASASDPWIPERVRSAVRARYGTEHVHAGFDPRRTALIVVDMQLAFLRPEAGYVACTAAVDTIPTINRLAAALRAAGGLVVWLKNIHDARTNSDWPVMVRMAGEAGNARRAAALAPEALGFQLDPELDVRDTDEILVKRRYSAFLQGSSDLEAILRGKGIDTLLMAGATTDVATGATMQANYTPGATVTPAPAGSGWQQFQSGDVGFLGGGLEQFAAGLMGKLAGTNLTPGPGGTIDPQARFNVPGGVDPTSAVARAQMNLSSQHGDDIATLFQPPGVGSVDGHPVDDSGRSGTDNQLNTDFGGDSHFGDY